MSAFTRSHTYQLYEVVTRPWGNTKCSFACLACKRGVWTPSSECGRSQTPLAMQERGCENVFVTNVAFVMRRHVVDQATHRSGKNPVAGASGTCYS